MRIVAFIEEQRVVRAILEVSCRCGTKPGAPGHVGRDARAPADEYPALVE